MCIMLKLNVIRSKKYCFWEIVWQCITCIFVNVSLKQWDTFADAHLFVLFKFKMVNLLKFNNRDHCHYGHRRLQILFPRKKSVSLFFFFLVTYIWNFLIFHWIKCEHCLYVHSHSNTSLLWMLVMQFSLSRTEPKSFKEN